MYASPLASLASHSPVLRSDYPLSDDQIHRVAPRPSSQTPRTRAVPSVRLHPHRRRAGRTAQGKGSSPSWWRRPTRHADRRDFTKHMIRLRHASQINGAEANEIVLLNSHDGTSSYQMLAGMFRFVCSNGLVCGDTAADVRIPHKGDVAGSVIEGAYEVLSGFEREGEIREAMRAVTLDEGEAEVFARAALALKYDDPDKPAPVSESQILMPRRFMTAARTCGAYSTAPRRT